jgi:hypothetical protein
MTRSIYNDSGGDMINIICALKCEASPIAGKLNAVLGKIPLRGYYADGFRVFVSGPGRENVKRFFERLDGAFDLRGDIFINIGMCGCRDSGIPKGTPFLINRIEPDGEGKVFYPDMLIKSGLREAGIVSVDSSSRDNGIGTLLADMESYAFFSEALKRTFSSNIHVIKIISDHMAPYSVTAADISVFINSNIETIYGYARIAGDLSSCSPAPPSGFADYFALYRFTESMKAGILNLIRFHTLKNGNPPRPAVFEGFKPPENKAQSLEIYNEIRKRLI